MQYMRHCHCTATAQVIWNCTEALLLLWLKHTFSKKDESLDQSNMAVYKEELE